MIKYFDGKIPEEKITVDNIEKSKHNNGNEWEKLKLTYKDKEPEIMQSEEKEIVEI